MSKDSEAKDKLDAAINEYLHATGWDESGIVTAWAAVGHMKNFDGDGKPVSSYFLLYKDGRLDSHVAMGLFQYGMDDLRGFNCDTRQED